MTAKIRVLLADDHKWVRQGIRDFLESSDDIIVVAEADNGVEALDLLRRCKPDISIIDIQMPVMSGVETIQAIRGIVPDARIIVLSVFEDNSSLALLQQLGVNGYLAKTCEVNELQEAVRAVFRGESVFKPLLVQCSKVEESHFLS